ATFVPPLGSSFVIVNNHSSDPISGTFAGLAEGATFTASGASFLITYQGGDGNDVVVTRYDVPTLDFGDAPDSFGTLLASDGARHLAVGPMLGSSRDAESDGQPNIFATGDDTHGTPDDEDGVVISRLASGGWATATVTVSGGSARLDAWVD